MRLGQTLRERVRMCWADDGKGNVCGLRHGHKGPHGYDLPRDVEVFRAETARRYYKLWRGKDKN